ncbi:MAG: hypothetical protein ACYCSF_13740 [Acidimicrobiales bacterium]
MGVRRPVEDVLHAVAGHRGRLPHTIPLRLEETPPQSRTNPGAGERAARREDLLIGYRHYRRRGDRAELLVRLRVGVRRLRADRARRGHNRRPAERLGKITNAGERPGSAVLQAYLSPLEPEKGDPAMRFVGCAREHRADKRRQSIDRGVADSSRVTSAAGGRYQMLAGSMADPVKLDLVGEVSLGE